MPGFSKGVSMLIQLYNILKSSGVDKIDEQFLFLIEYLVKKTKYPESNLKDLIRRFSHFKTDFETKWINSQRTEDRFFKKHRDWLENSIALFCFMVYVVYL